MRKLAGWALVASGAAILVGMTAAQFGLVVTATAIGFAIGMTALFVAGVHLITTK